jgi:hypothetical protein
VAGLRAEGAGQAALDVEEANQERLAR